MDPPNTMVSSETITSPETITSSETMIFPNAMDSIDEMDSLETMTSPVLFYTGPLNIYDSDVQIPVLRFHSIDEAKEWLEEKNPSYGICIVTFGDTTKGSIYHLLSVQYPFDQRYISYQGYPFYQREYRISRWSFECYDIPIQEIIKDHNFHKFFSHIPKTYNTSRRSKLVIPTVYYTGTKFLNFGKSIKEYECKSLQFAIEELKQIATPMIFMFLVQESGKWYIVCSETIDPSEKLRFQYNQVYSYELQEVLESRYFSTVKPTEVYRR